MLLNRDVAGMERTPLQVEGQAKHDVHEEDDQEGQEADANPEKEAPQGEREQDAPDQGEDRHRHNQDGTTVEFVARENLNMRLLFRHGRMLLSVELDTLLIAWSGLPLPGAALRLMVIQSTMKHFSRRPSSQCASAVATNEGNCMKKPERSSCSPRSQGSFVEPEAISPGPLPPAVLYCVQYVARSDLAFTLGAACPLRSLLCLLRLPCRQLLCQLLGSPIRCLLL